MLHSLWLHQSDVCATLIGVGAFVVIGITAMSPSLEQQIWALRISVLELVTDRLASHDCRLSRCSHRESCPWQHLNEIKAIADSYSAFFRRNQFHAALPSTFHAWCSQAREFNEHLFRETLLPRPPGTTRLSREQAKVYLHHLERIHSWFAVAFARDSLCVHTDTCPNRPQAIEDSFTPHLTIVPDIVPDLEPIEILEETDTVEYPATKVELFDVLANEPTHGVTHTDHGVTVPPSSDVAEPKPRPARKRRRKNSVGDAIAEPVSS